MLKVEKNCILTENLKKTICAYIPKKSDLIALERVFSTLADKTRIRIVSALSISPLCVSELCEVLEINQTTLSHQLAFLRSCGVVEDERIGKSVVYRIKNRSILRVFLSAVDFLEEDNAKNNDIVVDF